MFKRAVRVPALTAIILSALLFFPVIFPAPVQAAEKSKSGQLQPCDFPPLLESKAYQQFKSRPVSELSKLIYLIDRFGGTKIEIVYNGNYYKPAFVASLAKFFLTQNYHKEKINEWIMKWCNVSIPSGNLIWVRFPDGKFKLARDVLKAETAELEGVIKSQETAKTSDDVKAKQSAAIPPQSETPQAMLEKTANAAPPIETAGANGLSKNQSKVPPSLAS